MLFYVLVFLFALVFGFLIARDFAWVEFLSMANVMIVFGGLFIFLGLPNQPLMIIAGVSMAGLSLGIFAYEIYWYYF